LNQNRSEPCKPRESRSTSLGISLSDGAPDARTIWLFREKLTRAGAM
jgi:hypothetical protein